MLTEESGDEREEELVDEERRAEVQVVEFDDYNEVLVDEAASQKATCLDDAGIKVNWWDNRIQRKLTEHWSVQDNLKGCSLQNYKQTFDDPVDKFELKRSLRVLRKFVLRLWKSLSSQDFASWFEKEGKDHEEWFEI